MEVRPIDKSKPSNRRCWNCKHFRNTRVIEEGPYIESRKFYCETSSNVVRCWSCCPYFEWDPDKQYEQSTLIPPNEWVSVEERLPEYNPGTGAKSYWVAKKDNAGNWQMKIAQYCDYGYAMTVDAETEVTWRDWDFTKIVNVTHWMPLPAPPDRRPPEGEA